MARYNDSSPHCEKWTNRKLIAEARRVANLENFSVGFNKIPATFPEGWQSQSSERDSITIDEFCRQQTRLYRATYLDHVFDEIERRFCK